MGLLNNAPAFLNTKLGQAAGLAVTYRREDRTITITAAEGLIWAGDARFAVNTQGGPQIVHGERQYLIVAGALDAFGSSEDDRSPQEGDRITEIIDGVSLVFEVATPSSGDPAVRPSDPGRTRFRVNCKRVG